MARKQRTVRRKGEISGVGIHSGKPTRLRIEPAAENAGVTFIRGDTNRDGMVNIADAIASLAFLFTGGTATCLDAVDANGAPLGHDPPECPVGLDTVDGRLREDVGAGAPRRPDETAREQERVHATPRLR